MVKKLFVTMSVFMMMFVLSLTAFAADTDVAIDGVTLEDGYYVAGTACAVEKVAAAPSTDYFKYENGIITVYGNVTLNPTTDKPVEIKSGTLTITGVQDSAFEINVSVNSDAVIAIGDSSKLMLDGDVDFTVETSSSCEVAAVTDGYVDSNNNDTSSFESAATYTGDIYVSVNAGNVVFLETPIKFLSAGKVIFNNSGIAMISYDVMNINANGEVYINSEANVPAISANVTVTTPEAFTFKCLKSHACQGNLTVKAKSVYIESNYNAASGALDITAAGGDVELISASDSISRAGINITGANNVTITAQTYNPITEGAMTIDALGTVKISNGLGQLVRTDLTISNSSSVEITASANSQLFNNGDIKTTGTVEITNTKGYIANGTFDIDGATDVNITATSYSPVIMGAATINATGDVCVKNEGYCGIFNGGVTINNAENVDIFVSGGSASVITGASTINASGNVTIKNSGTGMLANGSLTINGAENTTLACNFSGGPAISSGNVEINATGDVLFENENGYATTGSFKVRNANNVTVHGNISVYLCSGGMDIEAKGDVEVINNAGMIASGKMNIKCVNFTAEGNTYSPLYYGATAVIEASGDVIVENKGKGYTFSSNVEISAVNVSVFGNTDNAPLIGGSITIDATENVEIINNDKAILVTGSVTISNAESVKLIGKTSSPLIVSSLTLTDCVNTTVENTDAGYIATNLIITGNATKSVDINGNRDIEETPENTALTDALISGSINITGVKPTADVSITNNSGQTAFVLSEKNTLTTQLGVLTLNGEDALKTIVTGTDLPETAEFLTGCTNTLAYSMAAAEGVTDTVSYAWYVDGVAVEETSDTFDVSSFADGKYKIECRATLGYVTIVSVETTVTVKTQVETPADDSDGEEKNFIVLFLEKLRDFFLKLFNFVTSIIAMTK